MERTELYNITFSLFYGHEEDKTHYMTIVCDDTEKFVADFVATPNDKGRFMFTTHDIYSDDKGVPCHFTDEEMVAIHNTAKEVWASHHCFTDDRDVTFGVRL